VRDYFRNYILEPFRGYSALNYPDGTPVATTFTMGYPSKGEKSSTIQSVISFIIRIDFPNNANVERMEGKALNAIFDLNETGSSFRLEVQAERSAADEQATPSMSCSTFPKNGCTMTKA
jgi:hypothetical protein